MLGGSSDKFVEILHDVRECERRSFPACGLQQCQEPRLSEFLLLLISGFRNAIGVNHQEITRLEPCDTCFVVFQQLDAKGNIVGFQTLDASILALENRRIVTCAQVTEIPCRGVQFSKKGSCKTSILTVGTNLSVQTSHKLRE